MNAKLEVNIEGVSKLIENTFLRKVITKKPFKSDMSWISTMVIGIAINQDCRPIMTGRMVDINLFGYF